MFRITKNGFVFLFCCQVIFISCQTRSQSSNKKIAAAIDTRDSILDKFKHYFNDTLPQPNNYVSDYGNIFTVEQESWLNHLIDSFEKQSTNEIAIVSFDTVMVTKQDFDALTLKLANAWAIGKEDKNNGVLIGICSGYKKMRIQNGKGIEKILSDAETKLIVDSSFIPRFKEGNYFEGTVNGIKHLIQKLTILK
jgi:uncharacterized protein